MPKIGYDMIDGRISRWLKPEGASVSLGEALVEIETDKATIQVESFVEGRLTKFLARPGDVVRVGESIALVESTDT